MPPMEDRVKQLFGASIESKMVVADILSGQIAKAGHRLVNCLLSDGKILLCGNGGSAANCLHFSTAMLNRFEVDRPPLPAISLINDMAVLTSLGDEAHYDQVFARQIQALGREGDVLVTLSTGSNSSNILCAIDAAHEQGMDIVVLNGRDGGVLANHLGHEDLELRVPGESSARIREIHLFILYCFCDLIDQSLFGQLLG